MTLDTFFEKFHLFADAPNAVAKMRELVLRLAFSGGLTGECTTDAGVPAGWETRTIESISASISSGFACSRSNQVENGHVHLRTHNISTLGTLNFDLLVRIDPKKVDPRKASIRAGDILFNNTNSQELVGKTSLVERDYEYGFSNHITRIRLKDGIFPGFVVFYLTLLRNSGYFARLCTRWINQAAVNTNTLKEQTIPIPPLAEQKRIVAKVDELMALCDQLERQQQERETRHAALARATLARFADAPTPENLNFLFHSSFSIHPSDLRKSILTLAVQGKLVSQDPGDEPAEESLTKVLRDRERQERSLRIKKPIPVVAGEGHMGVLPFGWCYASPDQITAFHKNALTIGPFGSSLLKSDYADAGVPLVFVRDIRGESFGGPDTRFVSDEKAKELVSHTVSSGDLLITKMGAPPGDTAIYPEGRPRAIITADCIKLTPHHDVVLAEYLRFAIRAPQIAQQFAGITLGVAQQKVSLGRFRCIALPLPPLAEQRRIVAKVDALMALVDALETRLATARTTATALLEAAVAELTTKENSNATL